MEKRIRFTPAPISRRNVAVYITVVVGAYDFRSLYVGFAVSAMSITCRGNSSDLTRETQHSRGFFISFTSVPVLTKMKNALECVLAGVELRFNTKASLERFATGGAGIACRKVVGRVIIHRLLVREAFDSIFFGQAHE